MHGHGLGPASAAASRPHADQRDEVTGTGRARIPFGHVPIERATACAAEDADVALRLWQALRPRLRFNSALALYEQLERRLLPVLLDMERAGIKVDADDLRRMSVDFEQRMVVIERDIHRLAGREFNVGSAKQLGEVLFDEMKLGGGRRMKTGAWGTDASVLQNARRSGTGAAGAHPRLAAAAEAEVHLCRCADRRDQSRDRPRAHLLRTVRRLHRAAVVDDPNMQNIPIRTDEGSRIRRAFIAENRPHAGLGRLLADRTAPAGPCGRHPGAARKFRPRRGHPCAHRVGSFRHPDGGHGSDDAAPRQGDQFQQLPPCCAPGSDVLLCR